jgi:hypothetical protein
MFAIYPRILAAIDNWINECVAHDGNFYDCTLKSAVRAMLTIVLAEDARAGGH